MPKTTTTTVSQNDNGQYQVTIPKALGDALALSGARVEWSVESGGSLKLRKADD